MAVTTPEQLRDRVRQLIEVASQCSSRTDRRSVSVRAFALAQEAEAMERNRADGRKWLATLEQNLRVVADSNIQRFAERLYLEPDKQQRELYSKLIVWEMRWYETRGERLETLQRLLRDCEERIVRVRAVLDDQGNPGAEHDPELLLNNALNLQKLLLDEMHRELMHQEPVS